MMPNRQVRGSIYGCIAAISYGLNPLCALSLYQDGINSNSVLFYRFFIGSVLLGTLMMIQKKSFALTKKEAIVLAVLGIMFAASSLTYFLSFYYMAAGVAATLVFAYPVFVAILMTVCFKEKLKWPSIIAIALTVCGIALLYKGDNGKPIAPMGIVLIMISALTYALYIIIVNRSGIVMSSIKLTFYAMLSCLACITVFAAISNTGQLQMLHTGREWFYAILLGLVPTVISLVFMAMSIQCIGSTPTAIMGALEPVTAAFVGITVFGELLTARLAFGILLILFSVTLIILDSRLRQSFAHYHFIQKRKNIIKWWKWK